MPEPGPREVALAEYKEVVAQFRSLTDIRFKLLTYLPLGTVAGTVVVARDSSLMQQPAISLFAFVVTVCIATYNKRNDQHYDELVARAAELEKQLEIQHGSFSDRPTAWLRYGSVKVEHRWPIELIYISAASLWAYMFTAALVGGHRWSMWLNIAVAAAVVMGWRRLSRIEKDRRRKLREAVDRLMKKLVCPQDGVSRDEMVKAIADESILKIDEQKARPRVAFYWKEYEPNRDSRSASTLLSGVIDLPARWIEDVYSGRR